jgi:hypothetical protein
MARLIEFFSRTGELVLDPFAGVGGTCWAPRSLGSAPALGIELDPRWVAIHERVVAELLAEHGGTGPRSRTSVRPIRAARARSTRPDWSRDRAMPSRCC